MPSSRYRRLDDFLAEIGAEHLTFRQSKVEVQILSGLVLDMIHRIINQASVLSDGWSGGRVIPVGSMAEGTRICQPNEFDFMVVVDEYDSDDIHSVISGERGTFIKLKRDCRREVKHFRYRNNCYCRSRCKCDDFAYMDKGIIKSSDKAISKALSVMERGGFFFSNQSFPGRLRVVNSNTDIHGPAIEFHLLWETYMIGMRPESMEISIDLVPVIEFEIDSYFRHSLDIFDREFYRELKDTDKIHVTPPTSNANDETEGLFKVSFALTELQLIRDETETHRKCYMFLKYIYRTNEEDSTRYSPFTSFALKNLMLQHSVKCEDNGLGRCLLKILRDLKHKMDAGRLAIPVIKHIFSTEHDLLEDEDDDEPEDCKEERKELSKIIRKLKKKRDVKGGNKQHPTEGASQESRNRAQSAKKRLKQVVQTLTATDAGTSAFSAHRNKSASSSSQDYS